MYRDTGNRYIYGYILTLSDRVQVVFAEVQLYVVARGVTE